MAKSFVSDDLPKIGKSKLHQFNHLVYFLNSVPYLSFRSLCRLNSLYFS